MAALELLREQPRRVEKLQRNAARAARRRWPSEGLPACPATPRSCRCVIGDADAASRPASGRSSAGCSPRRSARPRCPTGTSRLRLTVMASHTKSELREAAKALAGRGAAPHAGAGEAAVAERPCRRAQDARGHRPRCFDAPGDRPDPAAGRRPARRARPLRHRDRHRRRQVGGGRRDLRRAGGARRARGRLQAGGHRADEPPGEWPPDHELLAAADRPAAPRTVAPLHVRPRRLAALGGGAGGRADRPGAARRGARAPRERADVAGLRGGRRPAGAAHRAATRCATWRSTSACRWWWPRGPASGTINHTLLTVEAARAAGLGVAGIVMTPWPQRPGAIELSNRETVERLAGVPVCGLAPPRRRRSPRRAPRCRSRSGSVTIAAMAAAHRPSAPRRSPTPRTTRTRRT